MKSASSESESDPGTKPRASARNRRKKEKKAARRQQQSAAPAPTPALTPAPASAAAAADARAIGAGAADDVEIEYVAPSAAEIEGIAGPEMAAIFRAFLPSEPEPSEPSPDADDAPSGAGGNESGEDRDFTAAGGAPAAGEGADLLVAPSRRARKRMLQDSVALLKRDVARPDVVEVHDVTSTDPRLLVFLKGSRNAVPVPRHWCHKRKYLQGKRGTLKPPFQLPDFITATGITKLRSTDAEAQDSKTLKAKTRERAQPKMGRIEIDYQVLHDAFFVHQTRPRLSGFGDLYYEGKELEKTHSDKRPGVLSERLRIALGMQAAPVAPTEGGASSEQAAAANAAAAAAAQNSPPPWLVNMQRYGPPPAYSGLRVPGLTAPIPAGCRFGFGPGEWGRPPVDEFGVPLYGDVFGLGADGAGGTGGAGDVGTGAVLNLWGEPPRSVGGAAAPELPNFTTTLEEASLEMPSVASEVAATGRGPAPTATDGAPSSAAADEADGTASVASSVVSRFAGGLETPDTTVELRKGGARRTADGGPAQASAGAGASAAPQLYTVLEERKTELTGSLLGTKTAYVMPPSGSVPSVVAGTGGGASTASRGAASVVEVALNPEDLSRLDESEIARRYEQEAAAKAAAAAASREDFSALLDEQEKRRKRKASGGGGDEKKSKKGGFKF